MGAGNSRGTSGLQHHSPDELLQKSSEGDQGVGHAGRNHPVPDDDAYLRAVSQAGNRHCDRIFRGVPLEQLLRRPSADEYAQQHAFTDLYPDSDQYDSQRHEFLLSLIHI